MQLLQTVRLILIHILLVDSEEKLIRLSDPLLMINLVFSMLDTLSGTKLVIRCVVHESLKQLCSWNIVSSFVCDMNISKGKILNLLGSCPMPQVTWNNFSLEFLEHFAFWRARGAWNLWFLFRFQHDALLYVYSIQLCNNLVKREDKA